VHIPETRNESVKAKNHLEVFTVMFKRSFKKGET